MIPIESLDDSRVDLFRNVRDADLRGREGRYLIESEMVLRRAIDAGRQLDAVLVSPRRAETLATSLARVPSDVPVYVASTEIMTEISGYRIHGGALAVGVRPDPATLSIERVLAPLRARSGLRLVIAEGVTHVDNIGALFRNAAAFGVDAVLLDPTCTDPLFRKAIRVSMGHALSVPYAVSANWPADLHWLRETLGLTVVAAEHCADARPLWTLPDVSSVGVLFGSEADGISDAARAACDGVYSVPMAPGVPSLNVAVASAVFLYELTRGATS